MLVTRGPEIRDSTALTTEFSSSSDGAARRREPTGEDNFCSENACSFSSDEFPSDPVHSAGVWNEANGEPGCVCVFRLPGVPGVCGGAPPGVWNAGMRRTGENDASDEDEVLDAAGDDVPTLSFAAAALTLLDPKLSARVFAMISSNRCACESINPRRRRSSRSVSSRAVPSIPVGGLDADPDTLRRAVAGNEAAAIERAEF